MATQTERVNVIIDVDTDGTAKLDGAATKLERFQAGVDKLVKPAGLVAAALVGAGKVASDFASSQEQAMGAVDAVFGKNAKTVKGWADQAAQAAGLTRAEYGGMASVLGAQLGNLGLSADDAMTSTGDLIQLGADLAAQFGGSSADAVGALGAALRGEADPAERYGLALNQTAVNARLAAKGQDKLQGSALAAAKAQAVIELATEQAGSAVGAFAREQGTASGSMAIATASAKNAAGTIGTVLLPIIVKAAGALSGLAGWAESNSKLVLILAGVAGTLAAAILATSAALRLYALAQAAAALATKLATATNLAFRLGQLAGAAALKVITAAQWAFNAALSANPIGLVILAVIALIAIVVVLWKKHEGFRSFVLKLWSAVKTAASAAASWIRSAWSTAMALIRGYFTAYKTVVLAVWSAVKTAASAAASWIRSAWSTAMALVRGYFTAYRAVVTAVFGAVKTAASAAASLVKSIWSGAMAIVRGYFTALAGVARMVGNAIAGGFRIAMAPINALIGAVRNLISWISRIRMPRLSFPSLPSWLGGGRSAAMAAPASLTAAPMAATALAAPQIAPQALTAPAAAPSTSGLARLIRRAASDSSEAPVVINVTGALDPDSVARQIERLLARRALRTGRVVRTT